MAGGIPDEDDDRRAHERLEKWREKRMKCGLGWPKKLELLAQELMNIRDAKPATWEDPSEFTPWAQNRARWALEKVLAEEWSDPELTRASEAERKLADVETHLRGVIAMFF